MAKKAIGVMLNVCIFQPLCHIKTKLNFLLRDKLLFDVSIVFLSMPKQRA